MISPGSESSQGPRFGRRCRTVLRVCLSLLLLGWLASRVDLHNAWGVLVHVDLRIAAGSLCIYVVYQVLQTVRWLWLLRPFVAEIRFLTLFRYQLLGIFYGLFLPSAFGGDVAKGLHLGFHYRRRVDSLSSVIMARALGILGLWVFVVVLAALHPRIYVEQGLVWIAVVLSAVCCAALCLVYLSMSRRGVPRFRFPASLRFIDEAIDRFAESFAQYRDHSSRLIFGFVLSVGIHFVSYSYDYIVALSLGGTVPLRFFLIYGPFIFLLSTLPVFINGLGIRENGFVYFFTKIETVSPYWIFSVAILSYLQVIALGLLGGLLLLLPWSTRRPDSHPTEGNRRGPHDMNPNQDNAL